MAENLKDVLEGLGLGEYTDVLAAEGWNNVAFLQTLSSEELDAVAASVKMKPGHIVKFVQHFDTGQNMSWAGPDVSQGQNMSWAGSGGSQDQGKSVGKGKGEFWYPGWQNGSGQDWQKGCGKGFWWPDGSDQDWWWQMFLAKGKGKMKGKGKPPKTPGSKYDENADYKGKPGPNGEAPELGRWSYESQGAGSRKKWKWKPERTPEERELKKAKKAAEEEHKLLEAILQPQLLASQPSAPAAAAQLAAAQASAAQAAAAQAAAFQAAAASGVILR